MNKSPVILITGASGGVGQAAALACATDGARIAVHYHRNQAAADALCSSLPGTGHQVYGADIADPSMAAGLDHLLRSAK